MRHEDPILDLLHGDADGMTVTPGRENVASGDPQIITGLLAVGSAVAAGAAAAASAVGTAAAAVGGAIGGVLGVGGAATGATAGALGATGATGVATAAAAGGAATAAGTLLPAAGAAGAAGAGAGAGAAGAAAGGAAGAAGAAGGAAGGLGAGIGPAAAAGPATAGGTLMPAVSAPALSGAPAAAAPSALSPELMAAGSQMMGGRGGGAPGGGMQQQAPRSNTMGGGTGNTPLPSSPQGGARPGNPWSGLPQGATAPRAALAPISGGGIGRGIGQPMQAPPPAQAMTSPTLQNQPQTVSDIARSSLDSQSKIEAATRSSIPSHVSDVQAPTTAGAMEGQASWDPFSRVDGSEQPGFFEKHWEQAKEWQNNDTFKQAVDMFKDAAGGLGGESGGGSQRDPGQPQFPSGGGGNPGLTPANLAASRSQALSGRLQAAQQRKIMPLSRGLG